MHIVLNIYTYIYEWFHEIFEKIKFFIIDLAYLGQFLSNKNKIKGEIHEIMQGVFAIYYIYLIYMVVSIKKCNKNFISTFIE